MQGTLQGDFKILLINPRCEREIVYNQFPLGLSYITQALIDEGYKNIQIRDYNVDTFEEQDFIRFISKERFNIVGLTGLVTAYPAIKFLSRIIKETSPNTYIILGGGVATAFPEIVVKNTDVDIAVISEGETTIRDLCNSLSNGGDLCNVNGICFLNGGKHVYKTPPRAFIEELDSIPFPNRGLFPSEDYLRVSSSKTFRKKSRIAKMYASRGCPYTCGYCFLEYAGHRFRYRSPENIVEEIQLLKDKYRVTGIHFVDDVFTVNKNHTMNFCEELLRKGIKIDWLCSTRVNLVDAKLLGTMKRAGCKTICYGIESGNQRVLNEMKKRVTVEKAAVAVEITWQAGIVPYCFFIMGYFGESEDSIRDTVNFCIKHSLTGSFSFPTPLPRTDLYKRAKNMGLIHYSEEWVLENWGEWQKDLRINLTEIPDERLKKLKFDAEREISRKVFLPNIVHYFKISNSIEFFNYSCLRLAECFIR